MLPRKPHFPKELKKQKTPDKTRHKQDWFTKDCKNRQKMFRKCSNDLCSNPFDRSKRQSFVKARAAYKKVCRKAEVAHRQQLSKKLIEMGQSDPKLFWSTIKKMNNWGKRETDPTDKISPENWINHFENLLNDKNATPPP